MRFDLLTALWITTVVAVGLGIFGGWASLPIGGTFLCWRYLLAVVRPPASKAAPLDATLLTVAIGGVAVVALFLLTAPAGSAESSKPVSPLYFFVYIAVSILPATWIESRSPNSQDAKADIAMNQVELSPIAEEGNTNRH